MVFIMGRKGILITVIIFSLLMLTGCGVAPYELTDSETEIIADYAAHILSKYNLYQRDGIVYVEEDTEEEETEEEEVAEATESTESTEETADNGELKATDGDGTEEEEAKSTATLNEIFGQDTLDIKYAGNSIATSYEEDTYFALYADAGEVYLIVNIDITNNGDDDKDIDILSGQPTFKASVNDGEYSGNAEMTILMNDFSTYTGTVKAGETVSTVLLFQMPETITEVNDLSLSVKVDGQNYNISI
jgi:hypothetical protein